MVTQVLPWRHSGRHSDRSMDAIGRSKEAQWWYKEGRRVAQIDTQCSHFSLGDQWPTTVHPFCDHGGVCAFILPPLRVLNGLNLVSNESYSYHISTKLKPNDQPLVVSLYMLYFLLWTLWGLKKHCFVGVCGCGWGGVCGGLGLGVGGWWWWWWGGVGWWGLGLGLGVRGLVGWGVGGGWGWGLGWGVGVGVHVHTVDPSGPRRIGFYVKTTVNLHCKNAPPPPPPPPPDRKYMENIFVDFIQIDAYDKSPM